MVHTVHTIALFRSAKISNDWQHWKPFNKFTKISYLVQIWAQCNTMGAIIYAGSFMYPYLHGFTAINLRLFELMLSSVFA